MYPRIRFYLINLTPSGMTEDELYERELAILTDYHESYGKDGFGSEKTYAEDLPRRARQRARACFENDKSCKYSLETIAVNSPEDEEAKIAELKKNENFYRMVDPNENVTA